jgi:hypothetical protein
MRRIGYDSLRISKPSPSPIALVSILNEMFITIVEAFDRSLWPFD